MPHEVFGGRLDKPFRSPGRHHTMAGVIIRPSAKLTIFNQFEPNNDDALFRVQFNPQKFKERLSTNWARQTVPGLSHQVMQFINTNNYVIDLELFFRAVTADQQFLIKRQRDLLMSWQYPTGFFGNSIDGATGGAPPRLFLIWPNMLSFSCFLTSVEITHELFTPDGKTTEYRAVCIFEEVRDINLTYEDARDDVKNRFDGNEPEGDSSIDDTPANAP